MNKEQIKQAVAEVVESDPSRDAIRRVSLFGSYLHGDNRSDSDVDLLFESNRRLSLFKIGGLQYRLEQRLGRKVDFVPKNSLIPQLRDKVLPEAETIYEQARG